MPVCVRRVLQHRGAALDRERPRIRAPAVVDGIDCAPTKACVAYLSTEGVLIACAGIGPNQLTTPVGAPQAYDAKSAERRRDCVG